MTLTRRRVIRRTWNRIHCLLIPAYVLAAFGFGWFLAAVTH
jgi:hypothetical protein